MSEKPEKEEKKERVKMESYSVPENKPICLKCEKALDEREKIEMILRRLYKVKEIKVLQHGVIASLNAEIWNLTNQLDKDLEQVLNDMANATPKQVKLFEAKIKAISARKKLLTNKKDVLAQSRLLLKNLHTIEASLKAEIIRIERGYAEE